MKNFLTASLIVFGFLAKSQQAINHQWSFNPKNTLLYGGNVDNKGIITDAAGNIYITGYYQQNADFDPGPGTFHLLSYGTNDVYIAKYSASGTLIWAKGFGGTGNDEAKDIALDNSNNVYITGVFNGTVDFDASAAVQTRTANGGNPDVFVVKYDANGNFVFVSTTGSTLTDAAYSVIVSSTHVYVTGSFYNTSDFDPSAAVQTLTATPGGSPDAYVWKLDLNGNYSNAINFGGSITEVGFDLALDASNNVYVAGTFMGTCDFDPSASTATVVSAGGNEAFVAKYDSNLGYLNAFGFGGTGSETPYSMALDATGNIYVGGTFNGTCDFDPSASTQLITSNGSNDLFFAKYTNAGALLLSFGTGGNGTSSDITRKIAVDASNNIYITGQFEGTAVDFDPSASTQTLTSNSVTQDIFFAKYDASGNFVFANSFGNVGTDVGNGMYINSSSEIFLSGNYAQSVDFDPSASTNTLTSPPTYVNVFMSKYNSSGALQLVKGIGDVAGGSVLETVQNIIRDGSGNVYITGYFQGSVDFDPSASTQTLTSVGSNDIFLAKYNSAGSLVWAKSMGGAGADLGIALKIDASNNIILTGHFNSTDCDFDPSASTNSLATNGLYDVFIAKYDNNGNYLNAINVGGTGDDKSFSIALDGSNNIYIAGSMNATVDFDPSASTVNLTSAGSTDGYFAKYSNSLAYVTAGLIGGTSSDQVSGIEVNSTNEIIVGGQYQGTADFDPTAATQNITAANGIDAFFAKYTNAGAYVFAKSIGGTSSDQCADMTIDAAGNIIMTGIYSNTNADFDPSAALANITNYGNSDVYIAKYDGNGNYLFVKSISGSAADFVNTVVTDASGNIYVTGSFNGTADFDSGSATVNKTSNGNADTYIAKFDGNGNLIHAHNMGGVSVDVGYSIATDGAGTIYYTGTFNGLVDFDPLSTVSTLLGSNSQDVFVAKYTECTAVTTTLTAQTNPLCNSLSNGSATVLASGGSGFTYTWTPTGGNSTVAVNLAAGNYSFVAENSCGSKYTHTLTITQPPAIALNANTSSTQVCTPNSVTLTANATGGTGAFTYTWTNISTNSVAVITPTASADYTVVVLDANNCSATTTVNVIALSGPTVTANSSNSIICSGTSVTLTANGATSYTWSTSSNSNSIVVSPTVNTTYTVDGTSANGCSNSAVITQSVTVCNGINSALLNNRVISIYPNPTNGEFTLTLDNYNEKLEAKIYNNIGQLVKTVKVDGLMIKADIADLNNGIFFIRIHDADNAYEYGNFKLIKE